MSSQTKALRRKYRLTAAWYDLLDSPWERLYRQWRPKLAGDLAGRVLEAGVGTGRNLSHYSYAAHAVGIDISEAMLARAAQRARNSGASPTLAQADALALPFAAASFDAYLSTFLYCVLPDALQDQALAEMARVLKPGGRFRLLEIVYSQQPHIRRRQAFLAPFVQRVYGARFDRQTLAKIQAMPAVRVTGTRFLKDDTYLLIEGEKR